MTALVQDQHYILPLCMDYDDNLEQYFVIHRVEGQQDKTVWQSNVAIENISPDLADLQIRANDLLNDDGTIKVNELSQLVTGSGGDTFFATFVANNTNLHRIALPSIGSQSEMVLQQLVFTPISGIFHSFGPRYYVAYSLVSCGPFKYTNKNKTQIYLTAIKPDAAITLTVTNHVVLAQMELKPGVGSMSDKYDTFKCIQSTCMSAMGLMRMGVADKITLPFVLNDGETAHIYTTVVEKKEQDKIFLDVSFLDHYDLSVLERRAKCVALLAVLLSDVKSFFLSGKGRIAESRILAYGCSAAKNSKKNLPPDARSGNRGSSGEKSSSNPSPKKRKQTRSRNRDVKNVAMSGGEILKVKVHGMDSILREESPFCYYGDLLDKSPVFVKIWRENDKLTNREDIKLEVNLLKRANKYGVPCPAVVDRLTAFSLDFNHEVYHRLVMTRLVDDNLKPSDFLAFSMSLIDSVQRLHDAGILHCDIKPTNIVWDSNTKLVSLVDFGHAQLAADSTSYVGTVGFTAPEVSDLDKPHSCQSDAYSIGKTLLVLCASQDNMTKDQLIKEQITRVEGVAKKLSRNDPRTRFTLDEARDELIRCMALFQDVLPPVADPTASTAC